VAPALLCEVNLFSSPLFFFFLLICGIMWHSRGEGGREKEVCAPCHPLEAERQCVATAAPVISRHVDKYGRPCLEAAEVCVDVFHRV
jgi:hypothetical protein